MCLIQRVTDRYIASSRPLVFLDFDETLAHAAMGDRQKQITDADRSLQMRQKFHTKLNTENTKRMVEEAKADLEHALDSDLPVISFPNGGVYTLHPRPGLKRFLNTLKSFADLYILSAGAPSYLDRAVPALGIEGYFKGVISTKGGGGVPRTLPKAWVLVDDLAVGTMGISAKQRVLGDSDTDRYLQIKPYTGGTDNALSGIVGTIQDRLLLWGK